MAEDFWECEGCGSVIGGHFRTGARGKSGKAIYVVDCPTCSHSGYKTDEDLEHNWKAAKKRWITPHEELEGMTENEILRQHGFHDIANKHTERINPKMDLRYKNVLEDDELRKKKSSKAKSKRKPVKKVVKKCKCRK